MVSRRYRRRGTSALIAGAAFLAANQAAFAVSPNPLENAYWRFEEGTAGNTVSAAADNVVIDSINANHMRTADTGAGAPTYSSTVSTPIVPQTGAANAVSLQFAGNKDIFTNLKNVNHPIVSNGFTLEASFKLDSVGGGAYQCIVGKDGKPTASTLAPLELKVRGDTAKLQIEMLDGGGTARQVSTPNALSAGQWYHSAVVDTGTSLSLYLDSNDGNGYVLQGTTALSGGALVDKDSPWTIGRGMFNDGPADWINGTVQEVRLSNTSLDPSLFLFTPANTKWNVNSDGNWSSAANWLDNKIPRVAGATANLTDAINTAHTVTVDIPVTLGTLNFDNASGYVVAGVQPITIDTVTGNGAINVPSGSHTISAPLTLAKDTTATVAGGSTLTVNSTMTASGITLTKQGDGTLAVRNVRSAGLNVAGGIVRITPSGTGAGVSQVGQLTVSGSGRFDLTNNKLVVTTPGSTDALTALIASGRNGGGWAGNGIVTSQTQAATGNLTTLGIATGAQVKGIAGTATAVWGGQTVIGSDSLVMYTYGGDANLDGKINVDDYTRIDFNVPLGTAGWYNGDFNYDGKINVDDYTIIDFNVGIQGIQLFAASDDLAANAVPEPAALSAMGLALLSLRRRRVLR